MDETCPENFIIKSDFDLLNSPEKDSELRMNNTFEEDGMGRNANGEYLQCRSASPSLNFDFCDQICRLFDESDNREEKNGQPCCSSSFLSSNQPNSTDEEIRASFLNSIVSDLLCQRPAQMDVLVAGNEKRIEHSNEERESEMAQSNRGALELSKSGADKSLPLQSELPMLLLAEGTSSCAVPSSLNTFQNSSSVTNTENWCEEEIVEISNSKSKGLQNNFGGHNKQKNVQQSHPQNEENIVERCAFDPLTKRRFYEPHKRSGCDGVYCLSQITQIGERICSVENKLARLSVLFHELIEDGPSHPTQNGKRVLNQQRNHAFVRASNALTNGQQPQRFVGVRPPQPRYLLGQRAPQFTIDAQSAANPSPILSRNSFFSNSPITSQNNSNLSTFQPKRLNECKRSNALSVIPSKLLEYGVRIYFPENKAMKDAISSGTVCPICFAKIELFSLLNAHILRHINKKFMAEFFCCKLCKGSNSVHFLSVAVIREHISSAHGIVTDSYHLINIYLENNTHKGTTRTIIQKVLRRFAWVRFEQWRNISQIKAKLGRLKPDCSFPSIQPSKKQSHKNLEEGGDEDVVDRILFSPSQIPKNMSERFHRLKKIDRVSTDQMIVPICERSFAKLDNVRIAKLAKCCASRKNE